MACPSLALVGSQPAAGATNVTSVQPKRQWKLTDEETEAQRLTWPPGLQVKCSFQASPSPGPAPSS